MCPQMFIGLHVKYPLFSSDFNEILSFLNGFSKKKFSNFKFHENPSSGSRIFPCGRTDTNGETNSRFSKFSNAPKSTNTIITKNCALLRHYAASSGNSLPAFRDNLSVPSSWFKNYDYHYLLRNNPEEPSSQLLRSRSLKSQSM
jgi:hypothetical protein